MSGEGKSFNPPENADKGCVVDPPMRIVSTGKKSTLFATSHHGQTGMLQSSDSLSSFRSSTPKDETEFRQECLASQMPL